MQIDASQLAQGFMKKNAEMKKYETLIKTKGGESVDDSIKDLLAKGQHKRLTLSHPKLQVSGQEKSLGIPR